MKNVANLLQITLIKSLTKPQKVWEWVERMMNVLTRANELKALKSTFELSRCTSFDTPGTIFYEYLRRQKTATGFV